ncbi:MAG TPA: DUF6458 family protein [Acidimicrobiales bacterium]|nr:DUF6458 family protein [Acidimicrobiales bacterium]
MGLGVSIFLIAVGAILAFAIEVSTDGVDLNMVGVILMIVGGIGLLASMVFWSSWGGFGGRGDTVVVDRGRRRRRIIEEDVL